MQVDDRDVDIGQDDALPSVETTMRFLALCDRYGSPEAAACRPCRGSPTGREWPVWTAAQMRAAVEYFQEAGRGCDGVRSCAPTATRIRRTLSAAAGGGRGCAYGSGTGAMVSRVAFKEAGSRCRKKRNSGRLKDEEKSLRTQLVAIQRAIEAIEGADASAPPGAARRRRSRWSPSGSAR